MNKRVRLNDVYDGTDGDLICKLVAMYGGYRNVIDMEKTFCLLNKTQMAWIDNIIPIVPVVEFESRCYAAYFRCRLPSPTFIMCRNEPFAISCGWNLNKKTRREIVIYIPNSVKMSVYVGKNGLIGTNVELAYFNVKAVKEFGDLVLYITKK
jgi:hypothetical protein